MVSDYDRAEVIEKLSQFDMRFLSMTTEQGIPGPTVAIAFTD